MRGMCHVTSLACDLYVRVFFPLSLVNLLVKVEIPPILLEMISRATQNAISAFATPASQQVWIISGILWKPFNEKHMRSDLITCSSGPEV